jgi:hypothetical protein
MTRPIVRAVAALALAALLLPARGEPAAAQCLVDVLGVAVTDLRGDGEQAQRLGRDVADAIAARLEADNLFARIPADRFPASKDNVRPSWEDWLRVRADLLMTGEVALLTDGRYDFRFRLWDVRLTREVAAYAFSAAPADWQGVAEEVATTIAHRGFDIAATRCRPAAGQRAPFRLLNA